LRIQLRQERREELAESGSRICSRCLLCPGHFSRQNILFVVVAVALVFVVRITAIGHITGIGRSVVFVKFVFVVATAVAKTCVLLDVAFLPEIFLIAVAVAFAGVWAAASNGPRSRTR